MNDKAYLKNLKFIVTFLELEMQKVKKTVDNPTDKLLRIRKLESQKDAIIKMINEKIVTQTMIKEEKVSHKKSTKKVTKKAAPKEVKKTAKKAAKKTVKKTAKKK
jgi:hypothetical protein